MPPAPKSNVDICDLMANQNYNVLCTEMWIRNNRMWCKYEFTDGPFRGRTIIESRAFQVPWRVEDGGN
jgi:hypothetical protein